MTDIEQRARELLPLPEPKVQHDALGGLYLPLEVSDYARANVARATAATDAEIEALRADVAEWKRVAAALREAPAGFVMVPVEPTDEMVSAAEEAYMPFGDMGLAIQMAIAARPQEVKDGE